MVEIAERAPATFEFVYEESLPLWEKMKAIATKIYGAADITADRKVREQIKQLQDAGYGHFPVCVAKTQYSFSTDPTALGAPSGHTVNIREVRLAAGAEFIVMICGDIMTMPGLPKVPSAARIDIDDEAASSGCSRSPSGALGASDRADGARLSARSCRCAWRTPSSGAPHSPARAGRSRE